jgi:hypothetical protein
MPLAGIKTYVGNPIFGFMKILSGEMLRKNPKDHFALKGRLVLARMEEIFSFGVNKFQEQYTGRQTLGEVIAWRGRAYCKEEWTAFQYMESTLKLARHAIDTNCRVSVDDLYDSISTRALATLPINMDLAGCYAMVDPYVEERIYWGKGEKLKKRVAGRPPWVVIEFYPTEERFAKKFEDDIIDSLQRHDLLLPQYRKSRSEFMFTSRTNGFLELQKIIHSGRHWRFYNTIKPRIRVPAISQIVT